MIHSAESSNDTLRSNFEGRVPGFREFVKAHLDRVLISGPGMGRTYEEVVVLAEARARQMCEAHVQGAVVVAIPNFAECICTVFALLDAGAVPVFLNPALSARERTAVTEDCGAAWAVETSGPGTILRKLAGAGPVEVALRTAPDDPAPFTPGLAAPAGHEGGDWVNRLFMFYTSGSTGRMKGVVHTIGGLLHSSRGLLGVVEARPGDRYLITAPLFHSFGFVFGVLTAMLAGATLVVPQNVGALGVLEQVQQQSITVLVGSASLLRQLSFLAESGKNDLSSLRRVVVGGALLAPKVAEAAVAAVCPVIVNFYGTTETSAIAGTRPTDPVERLGTVGRALPGVEVRIVDDQRQPVPHGTLGEIACRTSGCFREYLNMADQTRKVKDQDGWYYTGDLGHLDEQEYLTVVGRKDDMIIKLGFNVYPREVDMVLSSCPGVADSVVVGAEDEKHGQKIRAVVVAKPGTELTSRTLHQFCSERLVYYKVPDEILVVDAFPRTAGGKVDLRLMKSAAWNPTRTPA